MLTLPWNLTTNTNSFEMLNKIGFFDRPFLFSLALCFFDTLYYRYVPIFLNGLDKWFILRASHTDLYRKCLYSYSVIPEVLYFQNRLCLGIEQLCFFIVDFTLLSQVCLASALFLTIKLCTRVSQRSLYKHQLNVLLTEETWEISACWILGMQVFRN